MPKITRPSSPHTLRIAALVRRSAVLAVVAAALALPASAEETRIFPTFPANGHVYGSATAMSGDRAIVGAQGDIPEAAYVYEYIAGEWLQTAKLTASDGASDDDFGRSVSISGDWAIVGAEGNDDLGSDAGAAYVFERVDGTWTEVAKLTASDGAASDRFGWSVSISGSYALVGAPGDDDLGTNSGSVYFFELVADTWTQVKKMSAADGTSYSSFGYSVSISGAYAIVGAWAEGTNGASAGAAYLLQRFPAVWVQYAKLLAPDGAAGDQFGFSVAMSGNLAVVGAPFDDDHGADSGAVYVWERISATWTYIKKVTPSDGSAGDRYGASVAVGGEFALVGAPYDAPGGAIQRGSAYLIFYDGGYWTPWDKLTASDGTSYNRFGTSVAIGEEYGFVGAPYRGVLGASSGAAYLIERSGDAWDEIAWYWPSNGHATDEFGSAVAIDGLDAIVAARYDTQLEQHAGSVYMYRYMSGEWLQTAHLYSWWGGRTNAYFGQSVALNGDRAIVGADRATGATTATGDAHLFARSGTWQSDARIYASDGASNDRFGYALAISGDTALIGAYMHAHVAAGAGAVYVFDRIGSSWVETDELHALDAGAGDFFGKAVAMSGDRALIGAEGEDPGVANGGAAYVFERSGGTWSQVAKLTPSDPYHDALFGRSVAIEGDVAVVGAPDMPPATAGGAAYVFERSGGSWVQTAKLLPAIPYPYDDFGAKVAIEGSFILVGDPTDDDEAVGAGAAHVFERIGGVWTEKDKISSPLSGSYDYFGDALAFSSEAGILIGARLHDDNGYNGGALYAYPAPVPEPGLLSMLASGIAGLWWLDRRKRQQRRG